MIPLRSSGNFLDYYKRFYCNKCNSFSIRQHIDEQYECLNKCDIDKNIDKSIYKGFFDRDEINTLFLTNERESLEKYFKENSDYKTPFQNLSNKQQQKLNYLFESKNFTEFDIDDLVIKYLKSHNLEDIPQTLNNYAYTLNLIEEIHYYLIRASQDIALLDIAIEHHRKEVEKVPFHSSRFFFGNCIESIWYAFERIHVYLGLRYNFDFKNNLELNTTVRIKNHLKKNKDYKASTLYQEIQKFMGSNFEFIDSTRKNNTHSLSMHIEDINNLMAKGKKDDIGDIYNNNGRDFDRIYFKPKLPKLISSIESLYDVLNCIIIDFSGFYIYIENNKIPMLNEFSKPIYDGIDLEFMNKEYSLNGLDKLKKDYFNKLTEISIYKSQEIESSSLQLLFDIFFRLEDVQKCIVDEHNLKNDYLSMYLLEVSPYASKFIDEKLFIYAGLSKIYSILDKISKYISSAYNIDPLLYFKDVSTIDNSINSAFLKKAIEISNSEEYKLIYKVRNRIAHNLSSGALFGIKGVEFDNHFIYNAITSLAFDSFNLILIELDKLLLGTSQELFFRMFNKNSKNTLI